MMKRDDKLRCIYLDLKGAYDRTPNDVVMEEIDQLTIDEVPKQLIRILANNCLKIFIGNESFIAMRRLAQGGVLSPALWNLFIKTLAERIKGRWNLRRWRVRPMMIYCDDVVLLFHIDDILEIQQILDEMARWAVENLAVWEMEKSKIVLRATEQINLQLAGQSLKIGIEEKYLGLWMNGVGIDTAVNIENRCEKARKKVKDLENAGILRQRMSIANRIRIYKTFVRPILEYALLAMEIDDLQWDRLEKEQIGLLEAILDCKCHNIPLFLYATKTTSLQRRREERSWKVRVMVNSAEDVIEDGVRRMIEDLKSDMDELECDLSEQPEDWMIEVSKNKISMLKNRGEWHRQRCTGSILIPELLGVPPILELADQNCGRWCMNYFQHRGIAGRGTWSDCDEILLGLKQRMLCLVGSVHLEKSKKIEATIVIRIFKRFLHIRQRQISSRYRNQGSRSTQGSRSSSSTMQRFEVSEDEMHWIITGKEVTEADIRVTDWERFVEEKIQELEAEPGGSSEEDTTESSGGRVESIGSDVVEEGYFDATDDEEYNAGRADARLAYWY